MKLLPFEHIAWSKAVKKSIPDITVRFARVPTPTTFLLSVQKGEIDFLLVYGSLRKAIAKSQGKRILSSIKMCCVLRKGLFAYSRAGFFKD